MQLCKGTSDEATSEALYGADFLPLKQFDVITMVADTARGTLRYLVNGVDAGVAFGPLGSGAACELEDDRAPFTWEAGAVLFPSCSLSNDKQVRWRSPSRADCVQMLRCIGRYGSLLSCRSYFYSTGDLEEKMMGRSNIDATPVGVVAL